MKKIPLKLLFLLTFFCLISGKVILADTLEKETEETPQNLCEIPIELELLNQETIDINGQNIITADTISQEYLSIPSLWWAKQQFDLFKGKLIRNWIAYPDRNRIDLVVNRQLWSLMNYLDRYRLLNEFGTVSRSYGYNLRIVNQNEQCLATYHLNDHNNTSRWEINFYSVGENSLQL
jgi:hypothetical protein